jgi:hypothetical protein
MGERGTITEHWEKKRKIIPGFRAQVYGLGKVVRLVGK